ncbi:zinc knuckle domain protein [Moniliophthora roreri]|nr:zinc knuckle domain protein [Moniliophthora roreri]
MALVISVVTALNPKRRHAILADLRVISRRIALVLERLLEFIAIPSPCGRREWFGVSLPQRSASPEQIPQGLNSKNTTVMVPMGVSQMNFGARGEARRLEGERVW